MKKQLTACFILLIMVVAGLFPAMAQSPFSDEPVSISQSGESAQQNDNKADSKQSIWQKLKSKVSKAFKTVKSAVSSLRTAKTPKFAEISHKIPGHETRHFVCQGICYLPEKIVVPATDQVKKHQSSIILLSYYPKTELTDEPSQIVALDQKTGRTLRRYSLFLEAGKPYTGHAGGITVAGKYLWVASGYKLYGFSVEEIIEFINQKDAIADSDGKKIPPSFKPIPERSLVATSIYSVDSSASFVSFSDGHLWVGDFVKSSNDKYAPIGHHSQNPWNFKTWIAGYKVDKDGMPTSKTTYEFTSGDKKRSVHQPDRVICCRESVQGAAICDDYVALSISYGAANAKLALYRNPFSSKGTRITYTPAGAKKSYSTDAWVLSEKNNWVKTVKIPAGSEDLEYDGKYVYVAFEGGSENYRHKWGLNPLVDIEEKFYLMTIEKLLQQK
jgi:hypothetical protein